MSAPTLSEAYRACERVTRGSGSSFSAAFWMLAPHKRRALHAIYAFCRLADDIADDPSVRGDRSLLLARWRGVLDDAYLAKSSHPVGVALADTVQRFRLPREIFGELLSGVESDLLHRTPESFDDLQRYCHAVASTVGILLVHVMGYRDPRSLEYAEAMGIAVQLTNVLRDVGADAAEGRIYLPREDLERFGVSPECVAAATPCDALRLLLACTAERARLYYERADALLPAEDRHALLPAAAMGRIYRTLLEELQRRGFPCLGEPLRLSRPRRLAIAASVWLGDLGGVVGQVPHDPDRPH